MLKLAGCICILLASCGMAYSLVTGLRKQISQTEALLDFFTAMEGEITYSRCPLPELLLHLSRHQPQPYQEILVLGSRKMEDNSEADIPVLWKDACAQYRPQLALADDDYGVLLRMGEIFAYDSMEASLQLLALCRKKLAVSIESRSAEFAGRRKLYCCLCGMAGLFAIIILL